VVVDRPFATTKQASFRIYCYNDRPNLIFYYREAELFFNIRYEDDVGSNGKYTVTMVTASSKSNIFFLCCIFVNVIWQIIRMVLTSKQREKLVLDLYKECKIIREIAKEAQMSFRDIGYILKQAGKPPPPSFNMYSTDFILVINSPLSSQAPLPKI
jgi:hypothetical protein